MSTLEQGSPEARTIPVHAVGVERLRRGLLPLVMMSFFHTKRSWDDAIRSHGITGSQMGVLSRIYDQPGISGAELSRQIKTTPQAVQLMLTTLERKELITRHPDPSQGRVLGARLTEEGTKIFLACLTDTVETDRQLSAGLSPEERKTLIDLLDKYVSGDPKASR